MERARARPTLRVVRGSLLGGKGAGRPEGKTPKKKKKRLHVGTIFINNAVL